MIRVYTNRYQTAVFNKEILKKYKTHDCFCRRNPWRHDKVIMLNVKNASFQFHAKCLKKISDILYKKAESTDTVWLEKFDRRVVKIALKFALNPKKYEKQPLSKETRFNIIKFAAKFNFSSKITEKMLDAGIYVKLIEYAEDTLNEYLMDLLPKAFDKFPEVERYPEFLKINERRRNKFLASRDANRKLIADITVATKNRNRKYIKIIMSGVIMFHTDPYLKSFLERDLFWGFVLVFVHSCIMAYLVCEPRENVKCK